MIKDETKTKKQLINELVELQKQTAKLKAKVAKSKGIDDRLKASEERYNLLIENANDGVVLHGITPEGKPTNFIEVNQRMCEITGYSKEELLNLSPLDIEKPEISYKEETKALGKGLYRKKNAIFERVCLTKDGRKIPLEISSHIFNIKGTRFMLSNVRDITERRQVEEALKKSEEQFKMLFVNAPLAYQSLDEMGSILDVNQEWLNILGCSREEVIDHHFTEFISPAYINYFKKGFSLFKKKGRVDEINFEMVRKDGKKVIVSFFGNIQRDVKGVFQRTHCIFQDITESKKIEETLRESEEKFRLAFENAKHAILWVNPKTEIIINCNKAVETLFEKPKEEIIGSHRTTLHPPEKVEYCTKLFKRQQTLKKPPDVELEIITKSGKIKTVLISDSIMLVGGQPVMQGIFRDITEHKKAKEALHGSEQKYRALFEESKDVVYISTPEGNFLDINPAGIELFGYSSKEELLQINITQDLYANPADRKIVQKIIDIDGYIKDYEMLFKRKNDEHVIVLLTTTIVRDEKGEVIAYRGIMKDITERKRLEQQLLHAQKMESIGQLAGGVAHDFNNLLTAIIGYGNLLKTEVSQDNLLIGYVTQILNSAERAANLTHNLLAFSRRQMINPKPVNVNNIINVMKTFLPRLIGEDIALSFFLTDKDLTVMADSPQIEQVLMNLATNARDAMPEGGSLIIRTECRELDSELLKTLLKTHEYSRPGSYALISVEDTGQGMDKKAQERLFDPFFTTKEVGKGTGLGLSMVYGIIKQHNGYIDVLSALGEGTTFNLYFPLTEQTFEELKKPEDLHILKGGTETILVAEDETYVRDFIKDILTGYGYKVIEAIDGEDAMRIFNEHRDTIQLLILDVVMPKKDGKMVYQEIKKVSPDTKVIFVSGYATDVLYKKGIFEEGLNFISKPMSPNELLIKVREVLDS
jgi:PAS domain S-box-containing protein